MHLEDYFLTVSLELCHKLKHLAGQLLKRYEASCTPVYVGGRNSGYFYGAGVIHPRLRTEALPRLRSRTIVASGAALVAGHSALREMAKGQHARASNAFWGVARLLQ